MRQLLGMILRWPWHLGTAIALLWNKTRAGQKIEVADYTIQSPDIPRGFDGFRILQLTDLHGKMFGRDQSRLLDMVKRLNPDLVVMTGDMYGYETEEDQTAASTVMSEVAKHYPTYAILGNHETRDLKLNDFVNDMRKAGVKLLRNQCAVLTRHGDRIALAGLETNDMRTVLEQEKEEDLADRLSRTTGRIREEQIPYAILLGHKPELLPYYRQYGAHLVFSGHAHGGLLEVPVLHRRLLAPGQGVFPHFTQGLYQDGPTQLIVGAGLGGPRIGICPEICIVTLKHQE